MLDIRMLKIFAEVLTRGSFAAAARQLGYSASAVSRQMSLLEQSTGVLLFERGSRSIEPTAAATALAARARDVLLHWSSLEAEIAAIADGTQGVLRLGTYPTAGRRIIPTALARLRERGELRVTLDEGETSELLERVEANSLDAAVAYEYGLSPLRWPGFLGYKRSLHRERLLLIASEGHWLATHARVHLDELESESWISTQVNTAGARALQHLFTAAGISPIITLRSNDYTVVQGLVSSGAGIAIVPELALSGDFTGCQWRIDIPGAWRESFIIAKTISAAVRTLESALLDVDFSAHFAGPDTDRTVS